MSVIPKKECIFQSEKLGKSSFTIIVEECHHIIQHAATITLLWLLLTSKPHR